MNNLKGWDVVVYGSSVFQRQEAQLLEPAPVWGGLETGQSSFGPSQAAPCQLLSRVTRLQWHTPHVVEHIACRVSQKFSHFCSGMSDRSVTTYLTLLREQHFFPGRQYRSWRLGDQALTLVGLLRWHLTSRNSRHWELSSESNAKPVEDQGQEFTSHIVCLKLLNKPAVWDLVMMSRGWPSSASAVRNSRNHAATGWSGSCGWGVTQPHLLCRTPWTCMEHWWERLGCSFLGPPLNPSYK